MAVILKRSKQDDVAVRDGAAGLDLPKEKNVLAPGEEELLCGLFLFFPFLSFFKKFFTVIQLQLYAFSPHPSTPPPFLSFFKLNVLG